MKTYMYTLVITISPQGYILIMAWFPQARFLILGRDRESAWVLFCPDPMFQRERNVRVFLIQLKESCRLGFKC